MNDAEAIMALRRISREQAGASEEHRAAIKAVQETEKSRGPGVGIHVRDGMGCMRGSAIKLDPVQVWHADGFWWAGQPVFRQGSEGHASFAAAVEWGVRKAEEDIRCVRAEAQKIQRLLTVLREP